MELNDDLKSKALVLLKSGMNLSHVYSALQGKVPYGDLWRFQREHPETGPISHATKRFRREGGGGGGGGGGHHH